MTDYIFVLGKNWILSIAELIALLENRGLRIKLVDHSRHVAVMRLPHTLEEEELMDIQSALGGCFKIALVLHRADRRTFERAYPKRGSHSKADRRKVLACEWLSSVWPRPQGQRIEYAVSTYPMSEQDDVDVIRLTRNLNESLKDRLLQMGAKRAAYYIYNEPDRRDPSRPPTALWPQTLARHNLLSPPNAEIVVALTDVSAYVGKTLTAYDSLLQQYRDESRPYVSAEISTSPKLCRTLLNLAGAQPGDVVLDPFCGTGTLLMEAALLGMRCIGIDIEGDVVRGARSNLKWMSIDLGEPLDYSIVRGDARNIDSLVHDTVDAIATEPPLGPVYAEPPTREQARQTIEDLSLIHI